MKATKHLLTSLVLGVLALRCGGETGSPQSGSESHFLDRCTDSTECGTTLACVCGACTRTCDTTFDCSGLSSEARCVSANSPSCNVPRRCDVPPAPPKNDGGRPKPIDAGLPKPNDGAVPTTDAAETRDAAHDAAVPIDGTVVATDAAIPQCTGGPCFCQNFAECTPAQEQTALPLGSTARRICGIGFGLSGRYCLVTAYSETEGGLAGYRCEVPFRQTCDAWSPATMCRQVLSCNLLMGNCPQDPLDCDEPVVPGDAAVTD